MFWSDPATIDKILNDCRTIAVVGLSAHPARPSHHVAREMRARGYRIIPVNPNETTVLGEHAYPSVTAVPGPVELVNIFRRSEDVPPIVEEAIAKGAKAVWMQEGVTNDAAARRARAAGLLVVMDRCWFKEQQKRESEGKRRTGSGDLVLASILFALPLAAGAADPPCDKYPAAKQARCAEIWKELNQEDGPAIAQFGLDQQKRRDAGRITAQQHLNENMAFIKRSTEKRLERLKARMAAE